MWIKLPIFYADFASADADGKILITHGCTFAEKLPIAPTGQVTGADNYSWNTLNGASFAYVGQHEKLSEVALATAPVQMGARVYLPTLGRFLQVDPIEGGTANAYVYALDPINQRTIAGRDCSDSSQQEWQS